MVALPALDEENVRALPLNVKAAVVVASNNKPCTPAAALNVAGAVNVGEVVVLPLITMPA
jgi:hypothetical protein